MARTLPTPHDLEESMRPHLARLHDAEEYLYDNPDDLIATRLYAVEARDALNYLLEYTGVRS